MASILILLLCLPNTALASYSFHHLPLPSRGNEALAFAPDNTGPYTGLNDGRVVRLRANGKGFEDFATTVCNRSKGFCDGTSGNLTTAAHCGRPLDLEFNDATGELYIVDAYRGLMVVGPLGGVATPVVNNSGDGVPNNGPDAIAIDPVTKDVYFTDVGAIVFTRNASDVLQSGDRSGRLLKYDAKTQIRSVVLTGLAAPAGAAVSKNGSFILISEYLTCTVTKFWLKGSKANTSETVAQLPGNPDNMKRTNEGEFWVAVDIQKLYPRLISFPLGQKLDVDGKIKKTVNFYAEYNSTYISEVHEHRGSLYVASILTDSIGVYKGLEN